MTASGWLVREGEVVASIEIAESRGDRRRGLLGREGITGGLLLWPARAVHTLGMRFPLDVAYCSVEGDEIAVVEVVRMSRHRVGRPRLRANAVLEAEVGAFERWRLGPGDRLEIKR